MLSLTKSGLVQIAISNMVKALFFHPGENLEFLDHLKRCIPDAFQTALQGQLICKSIPTLKHLITLTQQRYDGLMTVQALLSYPGDHDQMLNAKDSIAPEDIATIAMTSGSTGFPKAIPYNHVTLIGMITNSRIIRDHLETSDIFFNDRSLSWIGSSYHLSVGKGVTMVFVHPLTKADDNDVQFSFQVVLTVLF